MYETMMFSITSNLVMLSVRTKHQRPLWWPARVYTIHPGSHPDVPPPQSLYLHLSGISSGLMLLLI